MTPERSINHHFTYHVAQASQAKHGSLVDRGANGGLAGSDLRILSRSSRKCTVTGIDSHELQGLDVVQCAAIVKTNHGIVNLIMNEYACYGKGHTIHSSGHDTIYIKTQVFRLLRYYSPAPRNIARSDWATQNITHNMTSSKKHSPMGFFHSNYASFTKKRNLVMPYISLTNKKNSKESLTTIFFTVIIHLYISFNR